MINPPYSNESMRRYHEKKGNPGQRVHFREHLVQTEKALLVIAADFSPFKKKGQQKNLIK